MDLHHLRTFVTVAGEGNLTRAAERLHLSPAGASAHIAALEDELNVVLFDRGSRGMTLTSRGEALLKEAESTLEAAESLRQAARALQSEVSGSLRLGLNAGPGTLRIGAITGGLRAAHPGLVLDLERSSSGLILEAIDRGTLDMGFIYGPATHAGLASHYLATAALVVAGPLAWEGRIGGAGWAELAALPWISEAIYCPFQTLAERAFARCGLTPPVAARSSDEGTKIALIRDGVGLALLERHEAETASAEGGIVFTEPEALSCDLYLIYPIQRGADPAIRAVVRGVLEAWESVE